jgi:hypothetical protein
MQSLQDTIDTLLADIEPKLRPVAPSDVAIQRDRRLLDIASKNQNLKEARLQARSRQ